ncbi:hypothetical protein BV25DRAFT_123310 [Artomyces pyxidatus]|uniref:Uncharacterized protein n=1 Tax=Artomyces pyxidatus TaxID=48021 RepID=A0ACB8TLM4_9AGAM|nr:hypothetical protein BV25DRAFT_123310 [Artomyces pyxidatus]
MLIEKLRPGLLTLLSRQPRPVMLCGFRVDGISGNTKSSESAILLLSLVPYVFRSAVVTVMQCRLTVRHAYTFTPPPAPYSFRMSCRLQLYCFRCLYPQQSWRNVTVTAFLPNPRHLHWATARLPPEHSVVDSYHVDLTCEFNAGMWCGVDQASPDAPWDTVLPETRRTSLSTHLHRRALSHVMFAPP